MTRNKPLQPRSRMLLAGIGGVAASFLLALTVLFYDPFGWFAATPPEADMADMSTLAEAASSSGLWTCGMHPQVISEQPGNCPICQMKLVPLRDNDSANGESSDAAHDHPTAGENPGKNTGEQKRQILLYRNPMNPTVTSPVPAKDEMGMDYVPVYADQVDEAAGATVRIDSGVVQNMNVQIARVERRDLRHPIRTVGYLDYDQERMVTVTTKYSGFVEKVYVNYIGEPVQRGKPLFEVYAPELVQTEQELLSAIKFARDMHESPEDSQRRAQALVEAARERLGYWDISPQQIAQLESTGEVFRTMTVVAPATGLVMKRMEGLEGAAVKPGMEIFHLANLSSLWLSVEIFEDQVAWVREGTPAEISLTYFPGKTFSGRVRYIDPEFSEKTRTLSVKIEVPNLEDELRKGMFATVVFQPVAVNEAVTVPTQAILRTGERSVVVLALGDGRFAPRDVVIGHEAEGYSEILSGVEPGEDVVVSAQFLLDSESKLREAIQKMVAQKTNAAGSHAGH